MNQILLTDDRKVINESETNNKPNYGSYNSKPSKTSAPIDIQKIIMIFAGIIIIFGIAIAGIYGYKAFKNKDNGGESGEEVVASNIVVTLEKNDLTETGDRGRYEKMNVIVNIESQANIASVVYSWNGGTEHTATIDAENKVTIPVPVGKNDLTVKITDVNGEEKQITETYELVNEDLKPKIETTLVGSGKLKITATSTIPMQYIKYAWENDEEITVRADSDSSDTIEETIDVKKDVNRIKIIAVDQNDNSEIIETTFKGVNNPEITVTRKEGKLHMIITHEKGFKKIEYNINGKDYVYDENIPKYDATKTKIDYYFNLKEGDNYVVIKATSNEDTVKEYKGKCKYTAPETEE